MRSSSLSPLVNTNVNVTNENKNRNNTNSKQHGASASPNVGASSTRSAVANQRQNLFRPPTGTYKDITCL